MAQITAPRFPALKEVPESIGREVTVTYLVLNGYLNNKRTGKVSKVWDRCGGNEVTVDFGGDTLTFKHINGKYTHGFLPTIAIITNIK